MKQVQVRRLIYRGVIWGSIFCFGYSLLCGEFGVVRHYQLKHEVEAKRKELLMVSQDVEKIKNELANWKADSFYLEKTAREELGMGYRDEVVYFWRV